jgi:hypothetical protein
MTNVSRPLLGLLVATVVFFGLWIVALKPSTSSTSASGTGPGIGAYQSAINRAKASVAGQDRAAAAANATTATTSGSPAAGATPAAGAKPAAGATPATSAAAGSGHAAASAAGHAPPASTAKSTAKPTAPATAKPTAPATAKSTAPATAKTGHHARVHAASSTTAAHRTRVHAASTTTPTQRLSVVSRALAKHKVLALLVYNPAAADDQAVNHELRTIPSSRGRVVKLAIPVGEITDYPVITSQVQITSSPTLVIINAKAQAFTLVGFVDRFAIANRIGDALSTR